MSVLVESQTYEGFYHVPIVQSPMFHDVSKQTPAPVSNRTSPYTSRTQSKWSPNQSTSSLGETTFHSKKTGWNSREAKKRKDMKMRVVTQTPQWGWQRPVSRANVRSRQGQTWKERLPESAAELLTRLYESLIMSKNCELPLTDFWAKFDLQTESGVQYTIPDIEHTLSTVGVECNTQTQGKHVSTGRWLLLRHSHFLLRAAHTITWIDNPVFDADHPGLHSDHPEHPGTVGRQCREMIPVVWCWKSSTERWRWAMWLHCAGLTYGPKGTYAINDTLDPYPSQSQTLDVQVESQDETCWDQVTDDGIMIGESISAVDQRTSEMSVF